MRTWFVTCFVMTAGFSVVLVVLLQCYRVGRFTVTLQQVLAPRMLAAMPDPQKETLAEYVWRQCQSRQADTDTSPLQQRLHYHHLLVDDRHKVLYCYIPKVACSNWRRVFLVLTGHVNVTQMMHTSPHIPPYIHWLPALRHFNQSAIHYRLRNYFKFMFVRNPLERLLSAWRNKFQSNYPTSIRFRRKYVRDILQKHSARRHSRKSWTAGLKRSNIPVARGNVSVDEVIVPFEEFLRYIVDISAAKTGRLNEHWDYYYRLCSPCSVHYDFVGKYDTLEEDAAHVLRLLNVSSEVSFPARALKYRHKPTSVLMKKYHNVSASLLKQIIELYKTDFTLFNFSLLQQ